MKRKREILDEEFRRFLFRFFFVLLLLVFAIFVQFFPIVLRNFSPSFGGGRQISHLSAERDEERKNVRIRRF